jgi:hypothetical protein
MVPIIMDDNQQSKANHIWNGIITIDIAATTACLAINSTNVHRIHRLDSLSLLAVQSSNILWVKLDPISTGARDKLFEILTPSLISVNVTRLP